MNSKTQRLTQDIKKIKEFTNLLDSLKSEEKTTNISKLKHDTKRNDNRFT